VPIENASQDHQEARLKENLTEDVHIAAVIGSIYKRRAKQNDYSTWRADNGCLHRCTVKLKKLDSKTTIVKCDRCHSVIARWKKFSDDIYNVDEAYFRRMFILRGHVRELDSFEREILK
jgi:hypothetical protein